MKNFLIPTLVIALGFVAVSGIKQNSTAFAAPQKVHKVAICHGTASAKNPYVLIIVDEKAKPAHLAGHGKNSAPDFVLDGGNVLTPERETYFRKMSDADACMNGAPGNS